MGDPTERKRGVSGNGGVRRELAGRKRGAERRIDQLAKISSISSRWEEEDKAVCNWMGEREGTYLVENGREKGSDCVECEEGREELHENDDHGLVGKTRERKRTRCDM